MKKAMHVVDPDTGEVVGTVEPGDRIVRKASVDAYVKLKAAQGQKLDRKDMGKMKYKAGYLTVNTEEMQRLLEEDVIDMSELAVLCAISPYAERTNCEIKNTDGKTATLQDIADICGCARQTAYTALQGLVDKKLLGKIKKGKRVTYVMNPWICVKDMYVLRSLQELFGDYRVRSHGGKKWEDMDW